MEFLPPAISAEKAEDSNLGTVHPKKRRTLSRHISIDSSNMGSSFVPEYLLNLSTYIAFVLTNLYCRKNCYYDRVHGENRQKFLLLRERKIDRYGILKRCYWSSVASKVTGT